MKDYEGAERGKCLRCAEQGLECCEFVVHTEIEGEDDDDELVNLSQEVYRQRPLLPSLQARLASAHPKLEVTPITPEESQVLDVARGLFYPFDLRLCIKQSYKDTACLGLERDGFTYGEVGLLSFLRLLDRVMSLQEDFKQNGLQVNNTQAKNRGVFYDLGCGAGKALVLAALHRIGFDRCVGVELLPGLATAARVLAEQFNRQNSKAPLQIVEGDMEKVSLDSATMVLLNAGSWQEPSLSRLRDRLSEVLPDGGVLVTIRYPLAKAGTGPLEPVEDLWLPMSWGEARVYLAQKRRHPACRFATICQAEQRCLNLGEMD